MVILLTGPDSYRSQRRFVQLRDAFREKHDQSGMGTMVLDGKDATAEQIRTATGTAGFFSSKRFIGINHYALKGVACDPKELMSIVEPFAAQQDVIVVIRLVTPPAEGKTRGVKKTPTTLKIAEARTEDFPLLTGVALQRWITQEAHERKTRLNREALNLLATWDGNDMWKLSNDLDKAALLADNKTVTAEIIQELVVPPAVSNIFALTDALGLRQRAQALRLLRQELDAGTHPLALIATLANHLKTLWLVGTTREQFRTESALASKLRLHPFVVKKALVQARHFSPSALAAWHHRLVSTDEQLKSTSVDAEVLLSLVLAEA